MLTVHLIIRDSVKKDFASNTFEQCFHALLIILLTLVCDRIKDEKRYIRQNRPPSDVIAVSQSIII